MRHIATLILATVALLNLPALQAQNDPATIDCSLDNRPLTCNRADFLKRFAEARTLALESQPRDRIADAQLASFAKSLAKQPLPKEVTTQPADITLRLVRAPDTGFEVGPSDRELATLRVFATRTGVEASRLLWVERFRGQADMPWPAIVHALTQQLQATLAGH